MSEQQQQATTIAVDLIKILFAVKSKNFFKWANRGLFSLFYRSFQTTVQFYNKQKRKMINLVFGAGIRTQGLGVISLLPLPLDQGPHHPIFRLSLESLILHFEKTNVKQNYLKLHRTVFKTGQIPTTGIFNWHHR